MDQQKNCKTVTAIVPTYNEAERISRVLDVLTTYPNFKEIIVVDDGSTDETSAIVARYAVRYVKNEINQGKGYSMDRGVELTESDVIFFCDADISGLMHHVIDEIVEPVVSGRVDMFIGMRNRKMYYVHSIISLVPLFGGERALTRSLWQKLPNYYKHYFRVETGLNFYAKYYGNGFSYTIFSGLSQVIKEKKYGMWKGTLERLRLILNVISAQAKLQFIDIPYSVKNRRMAIVSLIETFFGMCVGILFLVAAYIGPHLFMYRIFAEKLRVDSSTPIVDSVLHVASITSVTAVACIGLFIFLLNIILFIFTARKLVRISHPLKISRNIRVPKF